MTLAPTDASAYTRMAGAMTKGERRAWNQMVNEMQSLAGLLRDRLCDDPGSAPRIGRLYVLANGLPLLHDDGKGASWSPPKERAAAVQGRGRTRLPEAAMTRYRLAVNNPAQWRVCVECGVRFRVYEWDVLLCRPCYYRRCR